MTDLNALRARWTELQARIAAAAEKAGRPAGEIAFIAASKTQDQSAALAAMELGIRHFGENRVQEAQGKWPELRALHPEVTLHHIGGLQSNKAAEAVALYDVIHSLDRPSLAEALAREMEKQGKRPTLLVQVNTGEEPQKSGVLPGELEGFLRLCRGRLGLDIQGLMTIPPADEAAFAHFAFLRELAGIHGLPWLSMGMSGDFESAIAFGATHIRLGSALFGAR